MTRKTTSKPAPKKSTRGIADLSPSKKKLTQVRGGAIRTIDGEWVDKGHK